jgi:hypothetical protein
MVNFNVSFASVCFGSDVAGHWTATSGQKQSSRKGGGIELMISNNLLD